jgi:hypothetical protein
MYKCVFSVQLNVIDLINYVIDGVEFETDFNGEQELDMNPLFIEAIGKRIDSHYPHLQFLKKSGYGICNIRLLSEEKV